MINNTSSNGVMVSMNVLNNNGIVNVDGSTTYIKDSSWNIWFTPCYDKGSFMHNSARPCCFDSDVPKCQMPLVLVGYGIQIIYYRLCILYRFGNCNA